jgi:membrane dipeptidase
LSGYNNQIMEFHKRNPVVDAHCDSIEAYVSGQRDLGIASGEGHLDLPRLRLGGVRVQFLASYIEKEHKQAQALMRCLELVEGCLRLIDANPGELLLLTGYGDVTNAVKTDRAAAVLSVEGGAGLGGKLFTLPLLHKLGVRSLTLTWNYANELAGGALEPGKLTDFGRKVVQEMNKLGMMVDVSHLSDLAFWDVLEVSTAPVIASHSCCRALHSHPRNLSDQQIKALAQNKGVVGINFFSTFLSGAKASLEDVVRHIEHICDLVGPEYVGIGSDYDGCTSLPHGLEDVAHLPALTQALLAEGYSSLDVAKIMGGNFLRVIQQVVG